MGRKRKYFNEEEKKQANREKVLRFYWRNKEECDKKARDRYMAKKIANYKNELSSSVEPEDSKLLTTEEQSTNDKQQ